MYNIYCTLFNYYTLYNDYRLYFIYSIYHANKRKLKANVVIFFK